MISLSIAINLARLSEATSNIVCSPYSRKFPIAQICWPLHRYTKSAIEIFCNLYLFKPALVPLSAARGSTGMAAKRSVFLLAKKLKKN